MDGTVGQRHDSCSKSSLHQRLSNTSYETTWRCHQNPFIGALGILDGIARISLQAFDDECLGIRLSINPGIKTQEPKNVIKSGRKAKIKYESVSDLPTLTSLRGSSL